MRGYSTEKKDDMLKRCLQHWWGGGATEADMPFSGRVPIPLAQRAHGQGAQHPAPVEMVTKSRIDSVPGGKGIGAPPSG